ncbi:unnamed protein product [Nezara viridula]|uniref:Neuropeptide n=1 Tax=Nezara viridula TaxID=85310 RepID=A0A9P0H972_NEZVI|nr:unnamed protein product [Nezara viridula]
MKHYVAILLLFYVTSGSSRFLSDSVLFDDNSKGSNKEIMVHQSEYILKAAPFGLVRCSTTLCCPPEYKCGTNLSCWFNHEPRQKMVPCVGRKL